MCKALDIVKIVDAHNHERDVPIISCPVCGSPVILEDDDNWCEKCDTTLDNSGNVKKIE